MTTSSLPGLSSGAARTTEWFDRRGNALPAVARMNDYWLDGLCHWTADRELATEVAAVWPAVVNHVRAANLFHRRLAACLLDRGMRQFVDIGAGLVRAGRLERTKARIVYADVDPVAVAYNTQRLADHGDTRVINAAPPDTMNHPAVLNFLDLSTPVAVFLRDLHHLAPFPPLHEVLERIADAAARGSCIAVASLCRGNDIPVAALEELYQRTPTDLHLRHPTEITDAVTVVPWLRLRPPALAPAHIWRADPDNPGLPAPNLLVGIAWCGPH